MATFSFAVPILPGKTDAWRAAIAEMGGARRTAYLESRAALGITREHVSLQATPEGDLVVVHMEATDPAGVMPAMFAGTSDFDVWFRETVLQGTHGMDPSGPLPPPVEVISDIVGQS